MTTIVKFWNWLFALAEPAAADEHCPYCHGLGYDSSGFTCTCLRRQK